MAFQLGTYFWPRPLKPVSEEEEKLIEDFHKFYYDLWKRGAGTQDVSWLGQKIVKTPLDLWVYQEIICELKPSLIIETGTRFAGSAVFFASIFELIGAGRVISIDIEPSADFPAHDRITYMTGASVSPQIIARLKAEIKDGDRTMVVLDSDHSYDNVLSELRAYKDFVTPGQYLVCEDTNLNGRPVRPDFGPGPAEALETFLNENNDFDIDTARERFRITVAPGGFLKRKPPAKD